MIKQAEELLVSGNYTEAMAQCCELLSAQDQQHRIGAVVLMYTALFEYRCYAEIADALAALANHKAMGFDLVRLRMLSHIALNEITPARQLFGQLFEMARIPVHISMLVKDVPGIQESGELYHWLKRLLVKLDALAPPPAVSFDAMIARAGIMLSWGELPGFKHLASRIKQTNPSASGEIGIIQAMAQRLEVYKNAGAETPRIFCIGLSKTATTSLNKALNLLDIFSAHWTNPVTGKLLDDEDIPLFDALSDVSISHRFEELYYTYPNSRFIYTCRNPAQWEKSVLKHYAASHRDRGAQSFASLAHFHRNARELNYGERCRSINNNLYFGSGSFMEAYKTFDGRVSRFFADKPAERFLAVDITAGDGWNKLCPFLEKPTPEKVFPWEYRTQLIIA